MPPATPAVGSDERQQGVISELIGRQVRGYMLRVGRHLAKLGVSPNLLTIVGLLLNAGVAIVIGIGQPQLGGVLLLVASAFDMLDGAVARATDSETRFGGFLDSTLDRYSEVVIFLGLLYYLQSTPEAELGSILIFVSVTGSLLISYARARAESAGFGASVGLVARPERVVLLAICLLIGQPLWALWILAVTTHLTAVTRILHVWRMSQRRGPTVAASGSDR